ncbi:MAG: hypothetical protein KDA87_22480 [Planctomycetales bacterium]|nr:hypothetical protein [Planctomycetales bacterium]
MTAVSGSVFHDLNGDGVRAEDEPNLTGWEVTLQSTESAATFRQVTDNQQFRFPDVPAGPYIATLDASDRWEMTFPDVLNVHFTDDELRVDFGIRLIESLRDVSLHPMDINMDGYVDESDIMQAWKSGKLNSDMPAKWEDGDWDLSGRFDTIDLVWFAEGYSIHSGADATSQLQPFATADASDVTVRYDGATGDLTVLSPAFEIAGVQLRASTVALDFGLPSVTTFGLFQYYSSSRLLYWAEFQDLPTLNEIHWPQFLVPGLSEKIVRETLQIDGARVGGGGLGPVSLDCVHCPSEEQSIITVEFYHDENRNGQKDGELLVHVPPFSVSGREGLVQPIGNRIGQPTWYRYVFVAPVGVPIDISIDPPGGWRTSVADQTSVQAVPTFGNTVVQIGLQQAMIRITEVHYAPIAYGRSEFIEITNFSDFAVDLAGMGIEGGIEFAFEETPSSVIGAGQRIVLVNDVDIFRRVYSDPAIVIAGQYEGRLSNDGESIRLRGFTTTLQSINYDDEWYPQTDERGASLTLRNPMERNAYTAADWRPSAVENGTPGKAPYLPGDANLDGVFSSADLVLIFTAGRFEDEIPDNAGWPEGDWDGDQEFSTSDLVYAFDVGTYVG